MKNIKKFLVIMLVVTNIFFSTGFINVIKQETDLEIGDIEPKVSIEDNRLIVTIGEEIKDVEYALVLKDSEDEINYQEANEFDVEKGKDYILFVKIADNDPIQLEVDTISPKLDNLKIKYDRYNEEKRYYEYVNVSFNISDDTCKYEVLNSLDKRIIESNITSNRVSFNLETNDNYIIKIFDKFNNTSSVDINISGIKQSIPEIACNIEPVGNSYSENSSVWAKEFRITLNCDNSEDYAFSLVKKDSPDFFNEEEKSFTITENGTYIYKIINKKSGVMSISEELVIDKIDNEIPQFDKDNPFTFSEDRNTITINASDDGCGIGHYELTYIDDNGENKSIISDVNVFNDVPRKEFKIKVVDHLNNESELIIDNERPIISEINLNYLESVTNSENKEYGKSAKVAVNASDKQGDKLVYAWYEEDNIVDDPNDLTFVEDNIFEFESNGLYYFFAKDTNGNISEAKELNINNIDKVVPEINGIEIINNYKENEKYSNATVGFTIKVKASDAGVGDMSFAIYKEGETPIYTNIKGEESEFGKIVTENGIYHIAVIDALGNATTKDVEINYIDDHKPTVKDAVLETDGVYFDKFGTYTNSNITISIPITDDVTDLSAVSINDASGIKDAILEIKDGNNVISSVEGEKSKDEDIYTFEINKRDVFFTMSLSVTDQVGNIEEIEALEYLCGEEKLKLPILIESNEPKCELSVNENDIIKYDGKMWFTDDIDINYSVSDLIEKKGENVAGIKEICIEVNGKEYQKWAYFDEKVNEINEIISTIMLSRCHNANSGELVIKIKAIDKAGNSSESEPLTLYRDSRAPEIKDVRIETASNLLDKIVSFFAPDKFFGSNDEKINLKVELNDTYQCNSSSGINSDKTKLNIVVDGKKERIIKPMSVEDNIYTFEISDLEDKFFEVYIETEDNLGQKISLDEFGQKIVKANEEEFEKIILDIKNPVISDMEINGDTKTIDDKIWINKDVLVKWEISDIVEDKDCSGLSSISVKVNDIEIENQDFSQNKKDEVSVEFNTNILQSNDDGSIVIRIIAIDNTGNRDEKTHVIYRDLDRPELTVEYDNNTPDSVFNEFYKEDRILTLKIKEMNFDPSLINVMISKNGSFMNPNLQWQLVSGISGTINAVYQTKLMFNEDADYEIYVSGKDMLDFDLNNFYDKFVLDKTKPTLNVSYDNNNAKNNNYFNQSRTATITIDEHNFDSSRVKIIGSAIDGGTTKTFPANNGWTRNGDSNITVIKYNEDALYTFDIEYVDKAGNIMDNYNKEEFFIDKTVPELIISGVEAYSANAKKVMPVVSAKDTNYDANELSISLTGDHRGSIDIEGTKSPQSNGEVFAFNDMKYEKENDDVYTIHAMLNDKAGNKSEANIVYSVNRFGSTYMFSDSLSKMVNKQYNKKGQEVIFNELNVNQLVESFVKLSINGQIRELRKDIDYSVTETREKAWYNYTYKLKSSLFEKDGIYRIIITSKDAAGNINENIIEDKQASINFVIDKTAPAIAINNLKSNNIYDEAIKKVEISVEDNLMLDSTEVLLNDKKIEVQSIDENNLVCSVPEKNTVQNLKVIVLDKAGNKSVKEVNNFTVSSNIFVRWYLNKPLFIGSLAIICFVILIIVLMYLKRNKITEN
ncbi:Ig-like domain repeat protein [Thomasclavelia cocleata]|uniref:Ig-like domain repeat protein n=1 Tax=Thomasclavelia cocleata TaxID=69824 RepID=UPI00248B1789|nr:Ig-like domain repeat protein [Thomasclavelia cocleata]